MNIYKLLKDNGCEIDSHESDLYVKKDSKSEKLLKNISKSIFISQIDGELWYELPFMYQPFWDKKRSK